MHIFALYVKKIQSIHKLKQTKNCSHICHIWQLCLLKYLTLSDLRQELCWLAFYSVVPLHKCLSSRRRDSTCPFLYSDFPQRPSKITVSAFTLSPSRSLAVISFIRPLSQLPFQSVGEQKRRRNSLLDLNLLSSEF